jgi:hypothetical protein
MRNAKLCLLALVAAFLAGCSTTGAAAPSISGIVKDEDGPVAGATVRVKATEIETTSARDGRFTLAGLPAGEPAFVTAWAPGYYIGGGEIEYRAGASDVEIILRKHADEDNPNYEWVSAFVQPGKEGSNCESCHSSALTSDSPSSPEGTPTGRAESLPFDEWVQDAHALSTQNPRFLSMYLGQDLQGNQSPPTEYGYSRDYGRFPLRPDLTQPYFGPGYKLDFPDTTGNCAACHAPAAAINNAYGTDPRQVSGVGAEGTACDFCHKVWDVRLDPVSGLPFSNMPGVLSFEFRRPPEGHQFFAGPLDDIAPGEDTYTPIQTRSQYCAPCHYGMFWGTLVYNSLGEWLDSPYSDPASGKTCQDCHMPPTGFDHFARLEKGGIVRRPQSIASHRMPGAMDEALLQNAVTMEVEAERSDGLLNVTVTITNDNTGHAVPTDSPLRQMILVLEASDAMGRSLPLIDGPRLPAWCGIGDPDLGYYSGIPGRAYARVLQERWTEVSPTGAYWNPTRVLSDNRLAPFASDTSRYIFQDSSAGQAVMIDATLLFRRAFIELMDQKGWNTPDILMEEVRLEID